MPTSNARESARTKSILTYLNGIPGCKAIKLHGGMFMAGHPDILCVWDGQAWFFEVKCPGKRPTPLQAATMAQWQYAGAKVFVVHTVADVREILRDLGGGIFL